MRKITIVAVAAVIAFGIATGTPLAQVKSQTTCLGTAGYDSTGTWFFQAVNPTVQTPVVNPSPNACVNIPEAAPDPSPGGVLTAALSIAGNIELSGTGNLSCGNGTLSGTVGETGGPGDWWAGTWTATFQNGLGMVTGTVTHLVGGGAPAALSGIIYVADGVGAAGVGVCNNDRNPSPALASLSVTP